MELDRRNFIKLAVGGVAGVHMTPLPWKLMDDVAIWTQNWPWVPVPPVGEFTHVKTLCSLCAGGCGIEVRKVDSRAVKIEGRSDSPVNPGGICPLGMGGLQLLYNESIRFTGPMKRVGPRGSGEFIDITWEEALHLLADRIAQLRKGGRPEALAAVDGNPIRSTMSVTIKRLLSAVGSPNYMRIPSVEDTYGMTNLLMQGSEGPMAYDLENSDFVLSFGSGLLEGWGSPGRVLNAWSLWRDARNRKTKVVQVESRASNTASKADKWLAPWPGTEAALALGLAHVIIKEGLYHTGFVRDYSFGFEGWTSADGKDHTGFKDLVLSRYSPTQVARITGLNPEDIISLARGFGRAKAPVAVSGKGKGTLNGSLYEFMAVQSLNALVGSINRPGGVLIQDALPLAELPKVRVDAVAQNGLETRPLDQSGTTTHPFAHGLVNNFVDMVTESAKSPVNTLLVFSANPVFTLPDNTGFKNALTKIPFIVNFSPFRDETSYMADLILPDHTYLEKREDIVWPSGLQYPLYGLTQQAVEPVYDTKNTGDVIIRLAKRIGGTVAASLPYRNFEAILRARAKGLFDSEDGRVSYDVSAPPWKWRKDKRKLRPDYKSFNEMWKNLKSGGVWHRPVHNHKRWEGLFKTPTGRFEFFSTQIELALYEYAQITSEKSALSNMGVAEQGDVVCMPHYEAAEPDAERKTYPLLMIPFEMINLAGSWVPNPPFLNKTLLDNQLYKNDSYAEINPDTAAKYNLKEADRVIIKSPKGEVQARVTLFEGAMPGIVYLPLGFGHTAYDEFLQGKGVNPNNIILAGKDPLSGHPNWWSTPVRLIKV